MRAKRKKKNKSRTRAKISRATRFRRLKQEVDVGNLRRVARGRYMTLSELTREKEGELTRAALIGGPDSVICLYSALAYYDLLDYEPTQTWIYVRQGFRTQNQRLRFIQMRELPEKGIKRGKNFNVTNLERTLVDCFSHSRLVDRATAIEVLAKSIRSKKTTVEKVIMMAKDMNKEEVLQPYLDGIVFGGTANDAR